VPQISSREAQTTVNLRDGETVIIGGLIQESDLDANNKIPLLGDLPLIGGAFRNKDASRSRNELIILVTPHLVAPDGSLERARQIDMQTNRLAPVATPSP
jgi:type II secretory pathway component GspD/PulD (secretin)